MQMYTRLNLTPFPDPSYFHIGDFLSLVQIFYLRILNRLLFQGLHQFFPLKFYKLSHPWQGPQVCFEHSFWSLHLTSYGSHVPRWSAVILISLPFTVWILFPKFCFWTLMGCLKPITSYTKLDTFLFLVPHMHCFRVYRGISSVILLLSHLDLSSSAVFRSTLVLMVVNNLVSIRRRLLLLSPRWKAHCCALAEHAYIASVKAEPTCALGCWVSGGTHGKKMLMGRVPRGSFAKTISRDNVEMNAQGGLWLHRHIW